MAGIRLDRLFSDRAGVSRSEARSMIKAGRVTVDSEIERSPDKKTDETCSLCLDGRPVGIGGYIYIMMNKPAGVISATDDRDQETVLSLLSPELKRRGLFPVGRLDKDTTGLLILTDDGNYCHRVTHPKRRIPKLYEVFTIDEVLPRDAEVFSAGVTLGDSTHCLPARIEIDPGDPRHCFVEILEGKYHQVKRMFAARGNKVLRLHRLSIGGIELDSSLKEGEARAMTSDEVVGVFMV